MSIDENSLVKAVQSGKEDGIMITKEAWKKFKDTFIIYKYDNCILIDDKNSTEIKDQRSLFYKITNYASKKGFITKFPGKYST